MISEELRTNHAAMALRNGDLHTLGRLMTASQRSLKDDNEISDKEINCLAETAPNIEGCLGAKMVSGESNRCIFALVRTSQINDFKTILSRRYSQVIGAECIYYACDAEGVLNAL